ncbi:adenosylcobinamide-GDP ribazoletransferase [Pseudobutyrivibrio ruminis]|uniref:Adenosylcobinamide-GDP ribazoletransferase n=1 Tax=Pseudobutyrivibrio ruminis DSM 9787 TaxID=1123011 RepID=A0A285SY47_9FIRM|nr:adenosylcobinamide-GDP ribazoletransferase [Pseudobutyrivibrio ruminis]SOC13649.1 cobalamin-5'-phosphate synthase [Pseudobutyrivibrio ruminis DSM 9787]
MKIIKAFIVAFSMYSRIPMPRFNWESEDMKYHLIFFPWVGAVIGGLEYLLYIFYETYQIPSLVMALLAIAIPLGVTGGFHLDGFMDMEDAMSSWQTKEKRLEILKDPHIGAFSVINVITVGILFLAMVLLMSKEAFTIWCFSFFVSRALSGICVVRCKKAKEDGLLHTEAKTASDKVVFVALLIQLILVILFSIYLNPLYGIFMAIMGIETAIIDMRKAKRLLGGITGDVMGWFVVNAEVLIAVILGITSVNW